MKQYTFKYAEEEVKSRYGHLIVWLHSLRTWCLVVAITFQINIIVLLLFGDNAKIIHGQP